MLLLCESCSMNKRSLVGFRSMYCDVYTADSRHRKSCVGIQVTTLTTPFTLLRAHSHEHYAFTRIPSTTFLLLLSAEEIDEHLLHLMHLT